MKKVYFFSVYWWALFLGIAILASLILLILILFPLGISVGSDQVFGCLALVSFLASDQIFKRFLKRNMLISKVIPYSILYVLIPLCLFVIFFGLGK
jgi:hypothetical protein